MQNSSLLSYATDMDLSGMIEEALQPGTLMQESAPKTSPMKPQALTNTDIAE